jgi:Flp pilus assembly protein TadG
MTIRRRQRQGGFVLVIMAAASIAMVGALGLAVDMGRLFIIKNETQAFCDAAALAAALELNGADAGVTNAKSAVTTMATKDKWNFTTTQVASPTTEFATTSSGTWTNTPPSPPTGYKYVRVKSSVSVPMYFLPVVMTTKVYTQTVNSQAISGQIDITTLGTGLSPYSGIAINTTGPNFGLTVGDEYSIQQGHFTGGAGCSSSNPAKCFNGSTCSGDTKPQLWSVASNWSSSSSGYWGASSNSVLESYILDQAQLQAVTVGTNLEPALTSGQKNSEGGWLDWRVNHDTDSLDKTWSAYNTALGNKTANGERLLTVPVLNPTSTTVTTVVGYGLYMLETNAKVTGGNLNPSNLYTALNGNDAWCAIYAGYIDFGSINPGVGGSTGAAQVMLVQ